VEKWLGNLPMANGSKVKIRNIMSALFSHAVRWEFTDRNPITGPYRKQGVRQSSKREKIPSVLTVEQIQKLLSLLKTREKVIVLLAATTGLRISELMALQWQDINWKALELNVTRSIVLQRVGECKTEASRKPIPIDAGLSNALLEWKQSVPYNRPTDWVFASPRTNGKQPYWSGVLFRKHVLPAVKAAGINQRVGWHTFRHTIATLLKANGEDIKTVQELLRHANSAITLDTYTQGITETKRQAHSKIVRMILPEKALPA
jgi:integrase